MKVWFTFLFGVSWLGDGAHLYKKMFFLLFLAREWKFTSDWSCKSNTKTVLKIFFTILFSASMTSWSSLKCLWSLQTNVTSAASVWFEVSSSGVNSWPIVTTCILIIFNDITSLCGVLGSCQRLLLLDMKMFTSSASHDSLLQTGWLQLLLPCESSQQTAFILALCACATNEDDFCAKLWANQDQGWFSFSTYLLNLLIIYLLFI